MNYRESAKQVLANIGGKDNVSNAAHCVTRLRLILNDQTKYNKEALEEISGVKGVFFNSGQLQIIFGSGVVEKVYAAFLEEADLSAATLSDVKSDGTQKLNALQRAFKVFSDIFIPIIPAFVGAAILLGVRSLLTTSGLFGMEQSFAEQSQLVNDFCEFLNVICATFAFLPMLIMYSAVKRFGGNPVLGLVIGGAMLSPSLMDANVFALNPDQAEYWNLLGFQIPQVAFQGGVFPAILTALFLAKAENFFKKIIPQVVSFILVPALTILASGLALFLVFGPLGNLIGDWLGIAVDFLYNDWGFVGAGIFAAALMPLCVTGTQHAIQPIEMQLLALNGVNYIQPLWSVAILSQGGAAIGMFLLYKRARDREVAVSSFIPTLFGISEPAIFAVNLKHSVTPFMCAVGAAFISGAFMKIFDVKANGMALTVIPGMTIVEPTVFIYYIIGNLLAFILPIVFLFIINKVKGVKTA